jgi:Lon protease-like protein
MMRRYRFENDVAVPDVLPILPLEGFVIFPHSNARMVIPPHHKEILQDASNANQFIGVTANLGVDETNSETPPPSTVGTMVRIGDFTPMPDGNTLVQVKAWCASVCWKRFRTNPT